MLVFDYLIANEAGWIGGTKSANGLNIKAEIIVNGGGNKTITERNGARRRLRKFSARRGSERDRSVNNQWGGPSYEDEMIAGS